MYRTRKQPSWLSVLRHSVRSPSSTPCFRSCAWCTVGFHREPAGVATAFALIVGGGVMPHVHAGTRCSCSDCRTAGPLSAPSRVGPCRACPRGWSSSVMMPCTCPVLCLALTWLVVVHALPWLTPATPLVLATDTRRGQQVHERCASPVPQADAGPSREGSGSGEQCACNAGGGWGSQAGAAGGAYP